MSGTETLTVEATDIATGYQPGGEPTIVTRASFHMTAGSIIAFIGPNGCGKTTLLKTLLGFLPMLSGSLKIAGLTAAEYRKQHGIGYLPETLSLPEDWTARGLLALSTLTGGRRAAAALPSAIEIAGIDFKLNQTVRRMSKGMRQRVALAMALVPTPNLLLLDEPEAGLDPAQRIRLRNQIREFARIGRIVLLASHDVTGLCTIADRVFLMSGQRLQPVDAAELSDPGRLLTLFGQVADA